MNLGTPPFAAGATRYNPGLVKNPNLPAGHGVTSFWGDIVVSSRGSTTDQAVVLLHERVHQALRPKVVILREFRATNQAGSYVRSSLWRYLEEALAETIAQVGVNGISQLLEGLRFPVANGYVYLVRAGSRAKPQLAGSGIFPEAAGLLYQGVVAGVALELRFQSGPAPVPNWAFATP